jgi:hypothetical protein
MSVGRDWVPTPLPLSQHQISSTLLTLCIVWFGEESPYSASECPFSILEDRFTKSPEPRDAFPYRLHWFQVLVRGRVVQPVLLGLVPGWPVS